MLIYERHVTLGYLGYTTNLLFPLLCVICLWINVKGVRKLDFCVRPLVSFISYFGTCMHFCCSYIFGFLPYAQMVFCISAIWLLGQTIVLYSWVYRYIVRLLRQIIVMVGNWTLVLVIWTLALLSIWLLRPCNCVISIWLLHQANVR